MQIRLFFYFIGLAVVISLMCCGGSNSVDNKSLNKDENLNKTVAVLNKEEQVSPKGFIYIHHIQNEGPKAQVGEYAYYDLDIYGFYDTLLNPYFIQGGPQYNKILSPEELKNFTNAILDVLPWLAIGDSITVKQPKELIQNLPAEYEVYSSVIFEIKLTDIKTPEEHNQIRIDKFNNRKLKLKEARAQMAELTAFCQKVLLDFKAEKLKDDLNETASGVKYIVHEQGQGRAVKKGNIVNVFNFGILMDGTIFENTFESGQLKSFQVGLGNNLPGLNEAITELKYGTKASIFLPYQLAYGEAGNPPLIPAKADLMIYLELME